MRGGVVHLYRACHQEGAESSHSGQANLERNWLAGRGDLFDVIEIKNVIRTCVHPASAAGTRKENSVNGCRAKCVPKNIDVDEIFQGLQELRGTSLSNSKLSNDGASGRGSKAVDRHGQRSCDTRQYRYAARDIGNNNGHL